MFANITEIPPVDNLKALDNCNSITTTWDAVLACGSVSYSVTLSTSDGVKMGPYVTNKNSYTFHDTRELSGIINVSVTTISNDYDGRSSIAMATTSGEYMYMYIAVRIFLQITHYSGSGHCIFWLWVSHCRWQAFLLTVGFSSLEQAINSYYAMH